MLQNPCKTLGFKKNMVYKIPPRGGGKPYPASGLIPLETKMPPSWGDHVLHRLNKGKHKKLHGPASGVTFYIGLYWENMKNFLSETTSPRALIFGM